ncbi:MAG: flavoprotein [Kangiellaceae bacterium]|nr:flavoprotein [Kangiellaceae bacterium]|tara:strand:+ start:1739 stop:2473 length:735 start_codon:yes stop_codon:yes gene_type:complete
MKSHKLYTQGSHQWVVFGRDESKPDKIIDTNQYLVVNQDKAMLLDPGGIELFSPMLASVVKHVSLEQIEHLFASHQDPDIISSLGLWDQVLDHATLHSPWVWEGFIRHFGMQNIQYNALPDEGAEIALGSLKLRFVPAHYLHSSGNFNVYDPVAKVLFSGDLGAALEAVDAPLFVEDFASHADKMKYFHQRWMPSNKAKLDWISRVKELDVDFMAPQHGRIFKREAFLEFLEWFEKLDVGIAVS